MWIPPDLTTSILFATVFMNRRSWLIKPIVPANSPSPFSSTTLDEISEMVCRLIEEQKVRALKQELAKDQARFLASAEHGRFLENIFPSEKKGPQQSSQLCL